MSIDSCEDIFNEENKELLRAFLNVFNQHINVKIIYDCDIKKEFNIFRTKEIKIFQKTIFEPIPNLQKELGE